MALLTMQRPFGATWRTINWRWWLMRAPMFLLAVPAAYGVGSFAAEQLPPPVAVFAGLAFECAYIGAIAAADQADDGDDWMTTALWWLVNLFAVLASVACNLLFFSGDYASITAESATHAVPLPILGFFYGLLLHRVATREARRAAAHADQAEQDRRETRYACSACAHWRGASIQAHHGHRRSSCGGHAVDTWSDA